MASASRFVYEIRAEYSGESSLQQLQDDLNKIEKIDAYRKQEEDAAKLEKRIKRLNELAQKQATKAAQSGNADDQLRYERTARRVQELTRALQAQRAALTSSAADLRAHGIAVSQAATHYARLQSAVQAQGRAAAARGILGIRSNRDINAEIAGLRRAYTELARSGNAGLSELHRAHQAMTARIRELRAQTGGWAGQVGGLRGAFLRLAAAIGGLQLGRAGLDSLTQYDDAMRRVAAISGATAEEFSRLDAQAQQLAASTRFSAGEIASAMQQLAAAGQTVNQIQNSIQAVMDVAAIAQMDVGEAADQVTNIMTQFGIAAKNSASVADSLVAGFTGAATSMSELALAMTYVGPVANALGYNLEDTTAILMSLANAGYKGERAGTALRGGLVRLIRPMRMGREVIKKYNIEVFDAQNNMRDYADILEDIGKSGMTQAEMIKIFGIEAGPGMIALIGQGSDAIRKYRQEVEAAGGQARKLAEEMESGIGGARRRLEAATDAMLRNFAAAAEPVLKPMIENLAELAAKIASLSPETKQAALGFVTLVAAVTALGGVIKMLSLARFVLSMGGLGGTLAQLGAGMTTASGALTGMGTALTATATTTGKLALLLKGTLALELVVVTGLVLKAVQAWRLWRQAEEEKIQANERLKKSEEELARKFEAISASTGVTVKTIEQLRKAIDEGKLHYDEATKSWVAGAAQRQQASEQVHGMIKAEGAALEELVDDYRSYVEDIRKLQDTIIDRQKTLTAELREMGRSGMSDQSAWQDQKREAEEYVAAAKQAAEEAKKALESGDTIAHAEKWKEAVAYADDAKRAYKALNKEVKDGDNVVISKAQALGIAMQGVKEAGELGISLLKQQQEEIYKAMDALEEDSGFVGLVNHLTEAESKWLEGWRRMRDVSVDSVAAVNQEIVAQQREIDGVGQAWNATYARFERDGKAAAAAVKRAIDDATRARTVTVHTNVIQGRRWGGLIGDPARYARGGRLPGYGGGDKVPAMLEPGEFVMRKEAVRRWGSGFFDALNRLRLPDLAALLPRMPQAAAVTPGRTVNINLTLPGGDTYQLSADPATAARIEREQQRWWNLRSSNRVKKTNFARTL